LYTQPAGWTRFGLNVLDKYSGDKRWLDPFFDSGNWYRAFHGTGNARKDDFFNDILESDPNFFCIAALANIYRHSFCRARVAAYGSGVYCSPNPTFVENGYVKSVTIETQRGPKTFKAMLQVAVNPDGVTFTSDDNVWLVPNPANIRAYRILIKEV